MSTSTKVEYGVRTGTLATEIRPDGLFSGSKNPSRFATLGALISALIKTSPWPAPDSWYRFERITTTTTTKTERRIEEIESARPSEGKVSYAAGMTFFGARAVGENDLGEFFPSVGVFNLNGKDKATLFSSLAEAFDALSRHTKIIPMSSYRVVRVVDIKTTETNITTEILK